MSNQLELFGTLPNENKHRYWRQRLRQWPQEAFESRHDTESSGWGMAMLGGWFADLLHRDGAMTDMEYIRWTKFERRLQRWDQKKNLK